MITFFHENDQSKTILEKEKTEQAWVDKLGKFKDEFDSKDGIVTIDYNFSPDDKRFYSFVFSPPYSHSEFIVRFNQWELAGRP